MLSAPISTPTPQPHYKCGPGFGTRGATAYALRVQGQTWDDIAAILMPPSANTEGGNSASAVLNVAKKYAKANGLSWPIHLTPQPDPAPVVEVPQEDSRQKRAYTLRVSGLSWNDVARATQYKHAAHTVTAARKHAVRMGLPWPIKIA